MEFALAIPRKASPRIIHLKYAINHEWKSNKREPRAATVECRYIILSKILGSFTANSVYKQRQEREAPAPVSKKNATRKPINKGRIGKYSSVCVVFCHLPSCSSCTSTFYVFHTFAFMLYIPQSLSVFLAACCVLELPLVSPCTMYLKWYIIQATIALRTWLEMYKKLNEMRNLPSNWLTTLFNIL